MTWILVWLSGCVEPALQDSPPKGCTSFTWYTDRDGDGYGDGMTPVDACVQPAYAVADASDCDDTNAAIHPGAMETCATEVDDNCDGTADDATEGTRIFSADTDGDGYGDPTATTTACHPPAGYTTDATDCDDHNALVNPGQEETCTTAADDDCDGESNERNVEGCVVWHTDTDGDMYGVDPSMCLCEATPALPTSIGGDCDDLDANYTTACRGMKETVAFKCERYFFEMCTVTTVGDITGDGLNDIGILSGGLWLFYSSVTADTRVEQEYDAYIAFNDEDGVLDAVVDAGDVNGDGMSDLFVGNRLGGDESEGRAYVLLSPFVGEVQLNSATLTIIGESAYSGIGETLATTDINMDGEVDFVLGADGLQSEGVYTGGVYIVYGPAEGDISLTDVPTARGDGEVFAGNQVVNPGDTDGDGAPDIVVTGSTWYNPSYVWLLTDPIEDDVLLSSHATATIVDESGSCFGISLAAPGDLNNDGYADFVVGAYFADGIIESSGVAYVYWGPLTGEMDSLSAPATLNGELRASLAGWSVSGAGDPNEDGFVDLLVGAPAGDLSKSYAYLVPGPVIGSYDLSDAVGTVEGGTAQLGYSVAGPGDVDGDHVDDLLISAEERGIAFMISGADVVW